MSNGEHYDSSRGKYEELKTINFDPAVKISGVRAIAGNDSVEALKFFDYEGKVPYYYDPGNF